MSWVSFVPSRNKIRRLELQDLCCIGGIDDVNLEALKGLRELRFTFKLIENQGGAEEVRLPESLSCLTDLEVLQVGTSNGKLPWSQFTGFLDHGKHLTRLAKLRELGAYGKLDGYEGAVAGQLMHLTKLELCQGNLLWLQDVACPQLMNLSLHLNWVDEQAVQQMARLTQLTCLRLNVGVAEAPHEQQFWVGLEPLSLGLSKLARLELVMWGVQQRDPAVVLGVPDISSFKQIKQLQLLRVMDPERCIPQQPSSAELLRHLSKVTQLEELQLEGYSTISPALVLGLAGATAATAAGRAVQAPRFCK
jgi:hypothetical protein